jgi:hypothetical protein
MTAIGPDTVMTQAEFARHRKVSRKSVTVWNRNGLLVLDDAGNVKVEETEWSLDQRPATYRGGVTHRPTRSGPERAAPQPGKKPARPAEPSADDADAPFDPSDENLPMADAVRRKENYLGLLRKHEHEVTQREWVRIEAVGVQVEREYAVVRERLLAIPGKVAEKLVGADRATIHAEIRREITEALHELHDPAGVAERGGAFGSPGARSTGAAPAADSGPDRVG